MYKIQSQSKLLKNTSKTQKCKYLFIDEFIINIMQYKDGYNILKSHLITTILKKK